MRWRPQVAPAIGRVTFDRSGNYAEHVSQFTRMCDLRDSNAADDTALEYIGRIPMKSEFPRHATRFPRWPLSLAIPLMLLGLVLSEQSGWTDDDTASSPDTSDPFAVPENASELSLRLFMTRLMRMVPDAETIEERREHFASVEAAADQLLEQDLEGEFLLMAIELKHGALTLQEQLGDDSAAVRLRAFIDTLLEDDRAEIVADAHRRDEIYQILHLSSYTADERRGMVDALAERLKTEVEIEAFRAAFRLSGALESVDSELAVTAYNSFSELIDQGPRPVTPEDVNYQEAAEVMRAAARRLDLPGKPMEVAGRTFDGDEFDIEELRGKVVLVDFWATWCAPCIEELPRVKELYEEHHDDGFEVVGISLDDSDTSLADFLQERQIPWITLFEPDPEKRGFNCPIVNHYGINELPTAILVDREGNVISVNAFRDGLAELLEEHL